MAQRPDYDQTLKAMFREAHDGVLALIAPGVRWQRKLSPELEAVKRQADLVWEGVIACAHVCSWSRRCAWIPRIRRSGSGR